MAPEIIEGLGYSFSVDLYSIGLFVSLKFIILGVIFYEFVCGFLPYGEELEDPFEIYQEIINTA